MVASWTRQKMEHHVTQRIREYADTAYHVHMHSKDDIEAFMREGGERRMWELIQEALADAGWKVIPQ